MPIGRMTEEAQEKNNKIIKYTREHFTRKNNRENTNRDIINRLLISTDPVVNNYFEEKSLHRELPEEVAFLVKTKPESENGSEKGGETAQENHDEESKDDGDDDGECFLL